MTSPIGWGWRTATDTRGPSQPAAHHPVVAPGPRCKQWAGHRGREGVPCRHVAPDWPPGLFVASLKPSSRSFWEPWVSGRGLPNRRA